MAGNYFKRVLAYKGGNKYIAKQWRPIEHITFKENWLKECEGYNPHAGRRRKPPENGRCLICKRKVVRWVLRLDLLPVCYSCFLRGVKIPYSDYALKYDIVQAVKEGRRILRQWNREHKKKRSRQKAQSNRYRDLISQVPTLECPGCGKKTRVQKEDGKLKSVVGRYWVNKGGFWRCRSCFNKERENNGCIR